MAKVVIKILQVTDSVVTHTVFGWLTRPVIDTYLLISYSVLFAIAKKYGSWLALDKVIAMIIRLFDQPCKSSAS